MIINIREIQILIREAARRHNGIRAQEVHTILRKVASTTVTASTAQAPVQMTENR